MEHHNTFNIRPAKQGDIQSFYAIAKAMHADNEKNYFERCLEEKSEGKREILLAETDDKVVGYIQLIFSPEYKLFKKFKIPEIQDLNVIPDFRSKGIGSALVDACEKKVIKSGAKEIGIGFGLDKSFGAAQRLYIKRGYVPDGCGVCYDEESVSKLITLSADKLLTLKLIKKLVV